MAILPNFLEGTAIGVLNDVLSAFHSNEGYAQPNRYEVNLFPPSTGKTGASSSLMNMSASLMGDPQGGGNGRDVGLRCESVTLPGINLATATDSNIYGPTRDIVEGVTYAEEVAMTFSASTDLQERVFFETWQKQAYNPDTWNVGYYKDYVGTVEIYLLDKQNQRKYGLKLWDAFPKSINGSDLSYGSFNENLKTTVNMSFRYWTPLDTNGQGPNILNNIIDTVANGVSRQILSNIPKVLRKL
jgi:hypothetical protein